MAAHLHLPSHLFSRLAGPGQPDQPAQVRELDRKRYMTLQRQQVLGQLSIAWAFQHCRGSAAAESVGCCLGSLGEHYTAQGVLQGFGQAALT